MRTSIVTAICMVLLNLCFTSITKAQITLDYVNDTIAFGEFYCINISESESKYFLANWNANTFSIYNMDMTPFIADVALPSGDSLKDGFRVMYVTKTLFDCDSTNIEYVYSRPFGNLASFRIFRTDGTLIFHEDSARGPYSFGGGTGGSIDIRPIRNTSDGTKLFLDILKPSGKGIKIYALCGNLPLKYNDQYHINVNYEGRDFQLFPNPTSHLLTFEWTPLSNIVDLELLIYNVEGREVLRKAIKNSNKFILDLGHLAPGTYLYKLVPNTQANYSGRFVIVR